MNVCWISQCVRPGGGLAAARQSRELLQHRVSLHLTPALGDTFLTLPQYSIRQVTAPCEKPASSEFGHASFIDHTPSAQDTTASKPRSEPNNKPMLEKILWKKTLWNREISVIAKYIQPLARGSQVYTEQQELLGRPLSPSLTVYKQAVPAIASITNRMCGIALSLGFGAAAAAASVGEDVPSLIYVAQESIPGFATMSKFAVAFPFAYHWLAGVRHQIWNYSNPGLMNLQFAPKSSYAIFATAALVSVAATGYTIRSSAHKEQGSKQHQHRIANIA